MTGTDKIQLVQVVLTSLVTLILPVIAYWIRRLEVNTNSMKDELVALTGKAKKAEGVIEGAKIERGRIKRDKKG